MTKRKICIVTGTRAEYGLLRWVMEGISKSRLLELQLIVTGMHLSSEFGLTYQEVKKDGFQIDKKVEMLVNSDTQSGISKSIGLKCDRCWHYEIDVDQDEKHKNLCGRCVGIINRKISK